MTPFDDEPDKYSKHPLGVINDLLIKAINAPNQQSLMFIITNDTHNLIKYNRAILWNIKSNKAKIAGISGNVSVNPQSKLYSRLTKIANALKDKSKHQIIKNESLNTSQDEWEKFKEKYQATVLWLPIYSSDKQVLGLWLERWKVTKEEEPDPATIDLLNKRLFPGYGAAWEKKQKALKIENVRSNPYIAYWMALGIALVVFLFVVRLPLSISVPCEVVPKDPLLVTAPLEGVIEEVVVNPGDQVKQGELLLKYDGRVPQRDLEIAKEEFELAQAEVDRSKTLGIRNPDSLGDLSILELKLEKAQANLDFQTRRNDLLQIRTIINGVVQMDDPDEWRGKPVQVGEKIMKIIDLQKTKIRMWVPQDDHVNLNIEIPIKVFLNIDPTTSYQGHITFISNETVIGENKVISFIVEANWASDDYDVWPGLKGTAIVYGEKVSLFYFLVRKPWSFVRQTLGI